MKDTARVLGRLYDAIAYRGSAQHLVETLGEFAGVPVWNGFTDEWHPTQSLCDMLTMIEHCPKPPEEIAFAYCGDARNNVSNSLLIAAAHDIATRTGARVTHTDSPTDGVRRVDFVYTDVWVSIGKSPEIWNDRVQMLRGNNAVRFDCVRPGREPTPHHQGDHGRHTRLMNSRTADS